MTAFKPSKPASKKRDGRQDVSLDGRYQRMARGLRFGISVEFLKQFDDIDKLKILNACVRTKCKGRDVDADPNWYKSYITKFYYCPQFNKIYKQWVESGKDPFMKPSLDHIHPVSKGGSYDLDNLQFLTFLENRFKSDMPLDDWLSIKSNLSEYLI